MNSALKGTGSSTCTRPMVSSIVIRGMEYEDKDKGVFVLPYCWAALAVLLPLAAVAARLPWNASITNLAGSLTGGWAVGVATVALAVAFATLAFQ